MNFLDIQIATEAADYPDSGQFQIWIDAALQGHENDSEILLRLVDEAEMTSLNEQYRHKSGPTNILSFPFEAPEGIEMDVDFLGDLVMCAPLINLEAKQHDKQAQHHWAHITVHGVLHLLGYDHIGNEDAQQMEDLEIEILSKFNIANPYQEERTQ